MGIESSEPTNAVKVIRNEGLSGRVCLKLGGAFLWISGSTVMVKASTVPSSDTDGTVVGTQV